MDLSQLHVFLTVAKEQSFSRAAHEQWLAHRFLQLADDDAYRGLCAVELLRGAGKALLFCDG